MKKTWEKKSVYDAGNEPAPKSSLRNSSGNQFKAFGLGGALKKIFYPPVGHWYQNVENYNDCISDLQMFQEHL